MSRDGVTKECPDCVSVLPVAAFGHNRCTRDGFACYCRVCFAVRLRPGYVPRIKRGRERVLARLASGMKRCSRCREWKPFSEFYRANTQGDGHYCYCRVCYGGIRKRWRRRR